MQSLSLKICVLACLLATAGSITLYAQESRCSFTGAVFSSDTRPVKGAIVHLSPGGYADTTDVSGRFAFTSIPSGKYVIFIPAPYPGFEDVRRTLAVPLKESERLAFVMHEKTYRAEEIVVMSRRKKEDDETEMSSSFVTVIGRSEFENNASTVADVIRATPGATITVMGGLGDYSEVSLRGSYSNQVQVYIDGMLLNEAVGGAVNLGTIPLTNVESVEVWRSGAPARFGGDAVGGVVNIKTRDIQTGKKTFSLGYGSFNTSTANMVCSIPSGMSRFLVTLDYAASNNDFEYKSDNGTMYNPDDDYWASRSNDEYSAKNFLGKISRLFGNGMLVEVSEHYLSNKKNLPGKDNLRYSHASLETKKNLFQAKMTANPFFSGFLEFQPVFHHIRTHERYRDTEGSVGWGVQDNIYKTDTFSFMSPLTVRLRKFATLNITPSVRHESYNPEHRLQTTVPLSCDREQLAIVFDASVQTPGERLIITSNVRRDRYFSSYEGEPSPQNKETPDSQFNHITSSHAGMRLKILKNLLLKGNYGDVSRVPSFYELFGDRGRTLSKPGLKPERACRWDAGGRLWFVGKNLPVSGTIEYARFVNTFRDLIQWYTNDAGFVAAENVSGSYVKGTEIIWSGDILNRIAISGNWTFQESKVTSEIRKYYRGKQLPNRPKNYGSVKIECTFERFVSFWLLDHKSGYFLDRANQEHKRYPGRSLHDIGVTIPFMNGSSTCTLLIKNITDVHTFDTFGLPKPGRSYMMTIVYTM